jgi:hypothetical protein
MHPPEIRLNKKQFRLFNDDDQFQLFCDEDGYPNFDNLEEEIDKLFTKYDYICVTQDDWIYGIKGSKRELLSDQATQGYSIAIEVTEEQ